MQQAASRSSKSEMSVGDAESWARLRLVQGESSAEKWELVGSLGHTTLTVGSGEDCTWVVREEGVRPVHFSLHWDGSTLRAADVYSAGDVHVDGALLTSQWRPLLGRVRVEFGKAALVVESSAGGQARSSEHPLDDVAASSSQAQARVIASAPLSQVPPDEKKPTSTPAPASESKPPAGSAPVSGTRAGKETLLGVAPLPQEVVALLQAQAGSPSLPADNKAAATPAPAPASPERAPSPSMKATLVGGVGIDLAAMTAGAAADPTGKAAKPNATLMGFNVANVMDALQGAAGAPAQAKAGEPKPAASSGAVPVAKGIPVSSPPVGVVKGMAPRPTSEAPAPTTNRRSTREGTPTPPPGGVMGGVAQMPFRRISSSPPGSSPSQRPQAERIGGAWQEGADAFGSRTLRGVTQQEDEGPPRSPHGGRSYWDMGERFSDVPTQMRDPASFEARRPNRQFPWRYVGVLLLTTVAYFAWLYLLDHI